MSLRLLTANHLFRRSIVRVRLNDTSEGDLQAFMKAVESREPIVYQEEVVSAREILLMLSPILAGIAVGISAMFWYLSTSPEPAFLFLMLSLVLPLFAGIMAMFLTVSRRESQTRAHGIRGVSRTSLSVSFLFLDMILNGHLEIGEFVDSTRLEEFGRFDRTGYGRTIFTLKRLDLGEECAELIRQKMLSTVSGKERSFVILFPFAIIAVTVTMIVMMIPHIRAIVPEEVAIIALVLSVVLGTLLISGLAILIRQTGAPGRREELERAFAEPDLRSETRLVLERLLAALLSECEHPLRILTISDYDGIRYTGTTYTTEKGITLREAILVSRRFSPLDYD